MKFVPRLLRSVQLFAAVSNVYTKSQPLYVFMSSFRKYEFTSFEVYYIPVKCRFTTIAVRVNNALLRTKATVMLLAKFSGKLLWSPPSHNGLLSDRTVPISDLAITLAGPRDRKVNRVIFVC